MARKLLGELAGQGGRERLHGGPAFKPRRSSPQPSGRGAEVPRAVAKAV